MKRTQEKGIGGQEKKGEGEEKNKMRRTQEKGIGEK